MMNARQYTNGVQLVTSRDTSTAHDGDDSFRERRERFIVRSMRLEQADGSDCVPLLEDVASHTGVISVDFARDATGRRVMELAPGPNDIRHLAPGVYFLKDEGGRLKDKPGSRMAVQKVVIQR